MANLREALGGIGRPGPAIVLAVAVAAGLYARLDGFGTRQLAVDEYFFAESVDLILDHGLPRFEDGGYYLQGLLPQYVTAAAMKLFGPGNFALRLPALVFGLLVPLLAFRYARLQTTAAMATLIAAALFVSSWEIEFSRFGRMYTALQLATLAFLYRFDRSIVGPEWHRRYRAHGWAIVATLCHFEGAILSPLLYAGLLRYDDRERFPDRRSLIVYGAATTAVTAALAWFSTFDFRRWGAADLFPAGYARPQISFLRAPEHLLWFPGADHKTALALVVLALGISAAAGVFLVLTGRWSWPEAGLLPIAGAALTHQVPAAVLIGAALALRYGVRGAFWDTRLQRALTAASAGAFALWAGYALTRGAGWIPESGAVRWTGALKKTFLSWPDGVEALGRPWAETLPVFSLIVVISLAVALAARIRSPWAELARGPSTAMVYGLLVIGLVQYFSETTRYMFLFYPVAVVTVGEAAVRGFGRRLGLIAFGAAIAISGDFDPRHILDAGGRDASYRIGAFEGRQRLWYSRTDYQSAAEYLGSVAGSHPDAMFVVLDCPPVGRMFKAPGYVTYLPREGRPFYQWSRGEGRRAIWGGALMSTPGELREATRLLGTLWLLRRTAAAALLEPAEVWGERLAESEREFLSRDGQVEVLRVRLVSGP